MILIVDPNEILLETMHDYLDSLGYACVSSSDPLAALDTLRKHSEIRLLICEQIIGQCSGQCSGTKLIQRSKAIRPELKSILISSRDNIDVLPAGVIFLAKPYSFDALGILVNLHEHSLSRQTSPSDQAQQLRNFTTPC